VRKLVWIPLMGALGACGAGKTAQNGPHIPVPTTGTFASASAACANEAFPSSGSIVYVCDCQSGADAKCVPGSDSNDGATPATALRSYGKVIAAYSAAPAGGTVAMCRGGAFSASGVGTIVANNNCRADNPCVLRDYAPTNWTPAHDQNPIIHTANNTGLTLNEDQSKHQEGFRILNLDFEGDGVSGSLGMFLYNDVSDVFVCNATFNGLTDGVHLTGSNAYPTGCFSAGPPIVNNCPVQRRVTFQGNTFSNIASMGFFGFGDSIHFYNNYWYRAGADSSPDHVAYFGALELDHNTPITPGINQDEQFVGNIVVDPGPAGVCDGTMVVAHGSHSGLLVQGNSFSFSQNTRTNNCFALGLGSGTNGFPDVFFNTVVDSNIIDGYESGGIVVNACQNCTVSNNLVMNDDANAGSVCIRVGDNSGDEYDLGNTATTIVNNTCYLPGGYSGNLGITTKGQGAGYVLANNAIVFNGGSSGNLYCTEHHLGLSSLLGGAISIDVSNYTSITNGGFDVTTNGMVRHVTGLDFSKAKTIFDVAVTLNQKLGSAASGAESSWMGSNFLLNTTTNDAGVTTLASAPTGGSGVTDVSAKLGLTAGSGGKVTATYAASDNSLCYAPAGPDLIWDMQGDMSLSAWTAASGFDAASQIAEPLFVSAALSNYDFHPALGSPLSGMGDPAYAPKLDITGAQRPNPPDIGAYNASK